MTKGEDTSAAENITARDDVWSRWRALEPTLRLEATVLAECLDGGQAFRWERLSGKPASFAGVFGGTFARVRLGSDGRVEFSVPAPLEPEDLEKPLARYLDAGPQGAEREDRLPWRSDPVIAAAVRAFPALRILRQEPGEVLLGFLCSSTKQILQIKQICAELARKFGREIPGGTHSLPSWEELATIPEAALRACRLGYRAAFVAETARKLAAHPGGANTWLTDLSVLPTPQARERLITLPGVGPKVADCVLLFGFHRLEAFPIDTWIERALTELYGLGGWKTRQLQQFAEAHFGDLAGLAQQFLFAYVRQPGRVELKKTNNSVL